MSEHRPSKKLVCIYKVSDHTGYHFYSCGKPAKFNVVIGNGPRLAYCGIHARKARKRPGAVVEPL